MVRTDSENKDFCLPYSQVGKESGEKRFELLEKKLLAPDTYEMVWRAPLVARSRKPGQFVVIFAHPKAERIPISLKGGNKENGTISVIIQAVGKTSTEITSLEPGQSVHSILGPLGTPTHLLPNCGTAVCLGGGYGTGAIISVCEANRKIGNRAVAIVGARSENLLLCIEELEEAADEVIITTDDGSRGIKGFVTTALQQLIDRGEKVGWTFSVGPVPMMRAVAKLTEPLGIPSYASLNAIMLDATGMCGVCRVMVGNEVKFACFHGPDFDSHKVNWENLVDRIQWYKPKEKEVFDLYKAGLLPNTETCTTLKTPIVEELDKSWFATLPEGIALDELGENLKSNLRMKIPRQMIPEQKPEARIKNFDEVALGYCTEQAIVEANRCIQCKKPQCVDGCPVNIDIPAFISLIRDKKFFQANEKILETNTLGGIAGRVCPQEVQCEAVCVIGKRGEPVAIGRLERFVSDYARMHGELKVLDCAPQTGKKVAIIGSGPAGLTTASEMIQKGHQVTVFEALHKIGGVLIYGIPEFRLPNEIVDAEVEKLRKMGVNFVNNALIGQAYTIDELFKDLGFDAVFLGTGAGLPWMLGIPGENSKGVYTANEFLARVNMMRADLFPEYTTPITLGENAVVIGCGNTAMDGSRVSKRLGKNSHIVYRRTRAEAPARSEEIEHAIQEGVEFHWLTQPLEVLSGPDGWVTGMRCSEMELGEPDASGRRRPVPKPGSEFTIACDTVISALGFGVNPLLASTTPDLKTDKFGVLSADKTTGKTTKKGVFAGGDSITGGATVILAMGQAKIASKAMHEYLMTGEWVDYCPE
ncbi:MAG: NADPH-dependent glutamate synthase [bacterium]|nr:NADPH-dependent glutamate synthase [bacterium]